MELVSNTMQRCRQRYKALVLVLVLDDDTGKPATLRQVAIEVSSLRKVQDSRYIVNLLDYTVSKHGLHKVVTEASVGMHRLRNYPATELSSMDIQRIMYQLLKGVAPYPQ
ncbi:hypothetical protein GBA52_028034 [Prunus armeniaca]|nr:hypothetical protein GBA52_028034 [Prunus armeniaca]